MMPRARTRLALLAAPLAVAVTALALPSASSAAALCNPNPVSGAAFAPLSGSHFQALDGDQCDTGGPLGTSDWEGFVNGGEFGAGGKGITTVDDPVAMGKFGSGGPQQEDQPDNWEIIPGDPSSEKTDIQASWGFPDFQSDLFLYLSYYRLTNKQGTGSANVDFELNKLSSADPANHPDNYWVNSKGVSLLKRSAGDRLIVFDQTGGTPAEITICAWAPSAGTTEPWKDGTWDCPGTPASATGLAQGFVNDGFSITNFLPGIADTTLASRRFGETAVNLGDALGVGVNQPCVSFGSLTMRSRQSPSVSATLADVLGPTPVTVSNCATVVIKKQTNPDENPNTSDFTFNGDGFNYPAVAETDPAGVDPNGDFTLQDDGTLEILKVEPNDAAGDAPYSVTETATGSDYELTGLTCDDGDSGQRAGAPATADIRVSAQETVTCTYTNTKKATILVAKDQTGGADSDAFQFDRGGDLGAGTFAQSEQDAPEAFSVTPNTGTGADTSKTYTVAEKADADQPAGYVFSELTCYDGSSADPAAVDSDSVVTGRSVDVKVAAGQTVLCVWKNVKLATLVVEKQTAPDETSGSSFGFTTDATGAGTFSLQDDQTETRLVLPGTYHVTESAADGYRLEAIDCDKGASSDKATREATYTLAAGDVAKCTFTNTKLDARIVVAKTGPAFAYHGDTVTFTYTVTNPGNTPLHDVTIADDKCSPVTGPDEQVNTGDADDLDPGDRWVYTCTTKIGDHVDGEADPLVNTVTVGGKDEQNHPVTGSDKHSTDLLHQRIAIAKTGPASATAGSVVTYQLTVTNPGDTAYPDGQVGVTDPQCQAPPVLVEGGKRRGGGADPSPATLDPGDAWTYSCSVQTAAGQTAIDNVANVAGTDVHGHKAEAQAKARTELVQPVQSVQPSQSAPPAQPAQPVRQVAAQRSPSGTAKLRAPATCVTRPFTVTVTGRGIKSVTFSIGSRKLRTLRASTSQSSASTQTLTFRIDPREFRAGRLNRVQARVTFAADTATKARTLRFAFQRCKAVAPRFTG